VHSVGAIVTRLGWYFREQPTSDFGIDAHAEAPDNSGKPSGRLLGLQIKGGKGWFRETTAAGVIYRGSLQHLAYWTEHSLPVVLVLYDPEDDACLWVQIEEKNIEQTAKGWKVVVPFSQRLDDRALRFWSKLCAASLDAKDQLGESSTFKFARAYCEISLHKVGKKYRPELYVPRQPDEVVWNWLTDRGSSRAAVSVILERAGSGKTNLICHMMERLLLANRPCVFLLGSDPLDNRQSLTVEVLRALGIDVQAGDSLLSAVQRLSVAIEKTSLCILIDAINETRDVEAMQNGLTELLAHFKNLPVRILISCRDIYWQFMNGTWVDIVPSKVQSLDLYKYDLETWPEVRDRYLGAYRIRGSLSGEAEEKCRHPLLLRFFCEAYENEDVSEVTQIRLKPLFERYLEKKVQHVAIESSSLFRAQETVTRTLEAIASEMLNTKDVSVSEDRIPDVTGESSYLRRDSIYVRLLDEDIILEEIPDTGSLRLVRRVRFVYEAFLEFMLARELSRRWSDKSNDEIMEELVRLVEPSASLKNVLGAMSFLNDFFVEREFSPWSVLAERGTAWQSLVLSSLRECDLDELDTLYKEVFPVLLLARSFETRAAAVEVLEKEEVRQILDPHHTLLMARFRTDNRREVRQAALTILNQVWPELGSDERVQVLEAIVDPSTSIRKGAEELVSMSTALEREKLFAFLVENLNSTSGRTRSYATIALNLECWPQARPYLLSSLNDSNPWVRSAALIRLRDFPGRSDLEFVLPLLDDVEERVRMMTAILIGNWHYGESLSSILERIEEEQNERVLSRLVEALTLVDSSNAGVLIPVFRNLLNHSYYWVRSHAGTGLFKLLGLRCLDELVNSVVKDPPVTGWFKRWPGIESFGGPTGIVHLCRSDFEGAEFDQKSGAFIAGHFTAVVLIEQQSVWEELRAWFSNVFRRLPVEITEGYLQGLKSAQENLYVLFEREGARQILSELLVSGPDELQPYATFLIAAFGWPLSSGEVEHVFSHSSVTLRENLAWGLQESGFAVSDSYVPDQSVALVSDDDIPVRNDEVHVDWVHSKSAVIRRLLVRSITEPSLRFPAVRAAIVNGLNPLPLLTSKQVEVLKELFANEVEGSQARTRLLKLMLGSPRLLKSSVLKMLLSEISKDEELFNTALRDPNFPTLPGASDLCLIRINKGNAPLSQRARIIEILTKHWPEVGLDFRKDLPDQVASRNRNIRAAAARTLSRLTRSEAEESLRRLLQDPERIVRHAALISLVKLNW
jgi:HEAT repeat protein